MYILLEYSSYYHGRKTYAWESFEELKKDVKEKLNLKSWMHKDNVDLRSLHSCIYFMADDVFNVNWKKTKSFNKFIEYRHGKNARCL